MQDKITQVFTERFAEAPAHIVRSPGRVNLIGEHTDYNDGFVLPMTINRATWIALRPRTDQTVNLYSIDFDDLASFDLLAYHNANAGWVEYVKGMSWALQQAGHTLVGWDGVVTGDVPVGAGLSSSASLELTVARAYSAIAPIDWQSDRIARLAQKAENEWVGVNCGIMDQMISAAGEANHALLIDCRSLQTDSVPLPLDTVVVVLDTGTRRGLVGSAYNDRRRLCEQAAAHFQVPALRDIDMDTFNLRQSELPDETRRRARHVISENARTLQAREAMQAGDAITTGQLMNESHRSLRDDFEVSSDALNTMVEIAQEQSACFGARMTGAGFGGCAVALVRSDGADTFAEQSAEDYQRRMEIEPNVYICVPTNGAEIVY